MVKKAGGGVATLPEPEEETEPGEQLQLLDTDDPAAKPLKACAKRYKKLVRERMEIGAKEVAEKEKLRALVKELGVKPNADGVFDIKIDGVEIKVTPRNELVSVKLDDDEDDE